MVWYRWGWWGVRGSQGLDPLRHFRDRGGMGGPTGRGVTQGGNPTGLEVGAGRVEVALTRGQTKAGSHPDDLAQTEVGVIKDPPDQVRAIEGGGRAG